MPNDTEGHPYPRERTWPDCEAEIERLRTALVADDGGNAAYQSGWHARDAEVGRLRDLLRESHLALSFMPDPTRKLLDLRYRIREALGDA